MAEITGIASGLIGVTESTVKPRTEPKQLSKQNNVIDLTCASCGGIWSDKLKFTSKYGRRGEDGAETWCHHCQKFFGIGPIGEQLGGCCRSDPVDAQRKKDGLRDQGFIIVLRELSLGAPDGRVINVGAGDIFSVQNVPPDAQEGGPPTHERTWGMYMLDLVVGPYTIKLFPNEWSPIGLRAIMEMKSAGEIVESFVATNDTNGHFTPTPEMKAQIAATFGRLTGAL